MKLNLACGDDIKEGWINIDRANLPGVDRQLELEDYPWPFETSSAQEIRAENILEHVENRTRFLEEIYRIAKNGAIIHITVPYQNSDLAWNDPTHKTAFGIDFMHHFTKESKYKYYTTARFKILDYKPKGLKKYIGLFISNIILQLEWTLEAEKE